MEYDSSTYINKKMSKVAVIMGSISDMPVMQEAIDILKSFEIEVEVDIVSAHRTPEKLFDFSQNAHRRGVSVVIAGAGGAAGRRGVLLLYRDVGQAGPAPSDAQSRYRPGHY